MTKSMQTYIIISLLALKLYSLPRTYSGEDSISLKMMNCENVKWDMKMFNCYNLEKYMINFST